MTTPLDRVRVAARVETTRAATPRQTVYSRPVGIAEVLGARHGAPTDISELRAPAFVAGMLAAVSVFAYEPALTWATEQTSKETLFVYRWIFEVLTVAGVNIWGPILAAGAVAALVFCAVWTFGISEADMPALVALTVAGVAAVIAGAPLLVAVVIGLVALLVVITIYALIAAACIALLIAILADL